MLFLLQGGVRECQVNLQTIRCVTGHMVGILQHKHLVRVSSDVLVMLSVNNYAVNPEKDGESWSGVDPWGAGVYMYKPIRSIMDSGQGAEEVFSL